MKGLGPRDWSPLHGLGYHVGDGIEVGMDVSLLL